LFIPDHADKSNQTEDKSIFKKLVKSYSHARYAPDFKIEESEVGILLDKVSALMKFSMKLGC